MQVRNPFQQVNHDDLHLIQRRKSTFLDIAIQRERIKLEDNIRGVISLINGEQLAQIFMVNHRQNLELIKEGHLHNLKAYLPIIVILREVDRSLE